MCLIFVALDEHPQYSLIVAANRDEFFSRPAAPLHEWPDTEVIAGKHLSAGGAWLGVTRQGRFSVLTNYRDPNHRVDKPVTRGNLVSNFLLNQQAPDAYLQSIVPDHARYDGFNLLAGDPNNLWYYSNRSGTPPQALSKGIYGLSNQLLDTPWPKVKTGKQAFELAIRTSADQPTLIDQLFNMMNDRTHADDKDLPDTGVGIEMERQLSSRFIDMGTGNYGTRCSTVLLIDRNGDITMHERTWDSEGQLQSEERYQATS